MDGTLSQPAYDSACCCLWLEAALQYLSQLRQHNQIGMAEAQCQQSSMLGWLAELTGGALAGHVLLVRHPNSLSSKTTCC